jgi:predicted AlkP superfamily phosphohydrolase/phosphomutase
MRPNLLIKEVDGKFIAAGGSCFLYRFNTTPKSAIPALVQEVKDSLNKLPPDKRKLFRVIERKELDQMGADSAAVMALAAVPGIVFSASTGAAKTVNNGPGTLIQQSKYEGVFIPTRGGHHGYDPAIPDMWTGFIAYGASVQRGGHIQEMRVVDIAPLIAKLLEIEFKTPDGQLVEGIVNTK